MALSPQEQRQRAQEAKRLILELENNRKLCASRETVRVSREFAEDCIEFFQKYAAVPGPVEVQT